jgi:hypothetical protein
MVRVARVCTSVWPTELLAVTTAITLSPTSASVSLYDCPVSPAIVGQFFFRSQRSHWKEMMIGCVPVQMPLEVVTVCPLIAMPDRAARTPWRLGRGALGGGGGGGGGAATMVRLGSVCTLAWPTELLAVTTAITLSPTSAAVRLYDSPVAPAIAGQFPLGSQRSHWKEMVIGCVPVQMPVGVVTVWPLITFLERAGRTVLYGGSASA